MCITNCMDTFNEGGCTHSGLPTDSEARKQTPVYSGCVKYFPLALAAISRVSLEGADKHCGGELRWDRAKSGDELDAMMRHIIDEEWAHAAWRCLANLQKLEEERLRQLTP